MLSVAVAGPSATVPVTRSAGTVILAMDVSGSMAAPDVTPDRLAAAQRAALSFIKAQPDSVDIGVVAFEQGGLTTAVPSADHAAAAVGDLPPGGQRRHLAGVGHHRLADGDHSQARPRYRRR